MALYIGNKKYCAVKKLGLNNQDLYATENGNYTPEEGYSGFGLVRVNVPEPILDPLEVNPTITAQTINPVNDGFSTVTVNPVTSAIDKNIKAANIKKGIEILGIAGTLEFTTETLDITPSTVAQTHTPTEDGYSTVTVKAVTNTIDSNIKAANIKKDTVILGITGTLIESNETTRNITANGTYSPEAPFTGFSSVEVAVECDVQELDIQPMVTAQEFTAEDVYHAFNPVKVAAVTADIDNNIVAGNIKKDVTILGVTGSCVELNPDTIEIDPEITEQNFTPTAPKNGYTSIKVNPVTSSIDLNIIPANIKQGIEILGVTGTCIELNTTTLNIEPKTTAQSFTPTAPKNGYSTVTVDPVTADIDANILAENIKQGIEILGITGACVELNGTSTTINPSTTEQTITPPTGYNAITSITVNPVTAAIDTDIKAENIVKGVEILGVTGTFEKTFTTLNVIPTTYDQTHTPTDADGYSSVTVDAVDATIDSNIVPANIIAGTTILGVTGTAIESNTQTKKITANGTYTPDEGYTGFSSVEVDINTVNNTTLTATPTTAKQTFTPESPYTGYSTVEIAAVTSDIDANIVPANILEGVTILGVTGTAAEITGQEKTVTPSGSTQIITPDEGYNALTKVTVDAISAAADPNILPENIVKGIEILGVTGTAELVLQEKHVTIDANTPTITTYTPDQDGCNGYSKFIFDLTWLEEQLAAINAGDTTTSLSLQSKTVTTGGTVTADEGYDGLSQVIVDASAYEQQIADLQEQIANLEAQITALGG